jgi:hypothetical protein
VKDAHRHGEEQAGHGHAAARDRGASLAAGQKDDADHGVDEVSRPRTLAAPAARQRQAQEDASCRSGVLVAEPHRGDGTIPAHADTNPSARAMRS